MKFMLEYPLTSDVDGGAFVRPENIREFALVAEAAGLDGIALTDHPAPSKKWLDHGGHETIDPFVGLGFIASATATLRVMTSLTVVPYRNPFLTAKSMTAVDLLSDGRATFVMGTGYLRSEFSALGVDFDERNELFDEAVDVMLGVWADDDFHYEGRHFTARGVVMRPRPVQRPHPPLWLGGNAKIVRRRVATWGQGWQPMLGDATLTRTTRTKLIEDDEQLARHILEIKEWMADAGRDPAALDVSASSLSPLPADASPAQRLDQLAGLADIGVTWTSFPLPRSSFAAAIEGLQGYGEEVVAHAREL